MRVGVFSVRAAPVDRQRIGQPLPARQPLGEARGSLPPVRAAAVPALQDVRVSAKLPLVGGNQRRTVLGARRGLEVAQFQFAVAADQEI